MQEIDGSRQFDRKLHPWPIPVDVTTIAWQVGEFWQAAEQSYPAPTPPTMLVWPASGVEYRLQEWPIPVDEYVNDLHCTFFTQATAHDGVSAAPVVPSSTGTEVGAGVRQPTDGSRQLDSKMQAWLIPVDLTKTAVQDGVFRQATAQSAVAPALPTMLVWPSPGVEYRLQAWPMPVDEYVNDWHWTFDAQSIAHDVDAAPVVPSSAEWPMRLNRAAAIIIIVLVVGDIVSCSSAGLQNERERALLRRLDGWSWIGGMVESRHAPLQISRLSRSLSGTRLARSFVRHAPRSASFVRHASVSVHYIHVHECVAAGHVPVA